MDTRQRIEYYLQKISDQQFQLYNVRLELEQQQLPEEEIKMIVKAVDEELQKQLLRKSSSDSATDIIRIGIVFMIIGVLITIATFSRIIDTGGIFVLAYGPFVGGLSMVMVGWIKRKKKKADPLRERSENFSGTREISFRRRRQ